MSIRHRHGTLEKRNPVARTQVDLPATVDAAVRLLQGLVTRDEQARIALLKEDELQAQHFGLGQWIRNNLGLWKGNTALIAATGATHADDASEVIIREFWLRLRNDLPKVH